MSKNRGHNVRNSNNQTITRTVRVEAPKSGLEAALNEALGATNEPEQVVTPLPQEGAPVEPENGQGSEGGEAPETAAPAAEAKPSKLGEGRKVRELKQGDQFRYKSSSAKWLCTSASDDGSMIEMSKEGGKSWKVTKARELDQIVYLIAKAPAIEAAPAPEVAADAAE